MFDPISAAALLEEKNEPRLLDLMAGILIGISPIIHLILVKGVNVPYGRFTSSSWGTLISARLAWFVQEAPALFLSAYFFLTRKAELSMPNAILLAMYLIHYLNRGALYPFRIRGGKPTPFIIFMLAFTFCFFNTYMQILYHLTHAKYPSDWIYRPNFIIGVFIFAWGMWTNVTCDDILRNLRKPGETGYKIPQGNMFQYVSCGNLFGEAVEWIGYAIASWSLQAAAFAIFAVLFLSFIL